MEEQIEIFKSIDPTLQKSNQESGLDHANLARLKMDLHTLKGNTSIYGFKTLASRIHQLEDCLGSQTIDWKQAHGQWEIIKDEWKFESSDLEQIFNLKENKSKIQIDREIFRDLRQHLETKNDQEGILILENCTKSSAQEIFKRFSDYIEELNQRFPEKQVFLNFVEDSDRISFEDMKPINAGITHIIRNCFDHGIEPIETRLDKSKGPAGEIRIGIYRQNNKYIHLIIKDDGQGIAAKKLAEKALNSGFWNKETYNQSTEQQQIELIFEDGISSKASVTDISGRGVGMSAVKREVESLGGEISVYSNPGEGTQFELTFPSQELLNSRIQTSG